MTEQNIIAKYVPNFVTLLSLSSGFTSISFSLNKEWEIAIYLILLATVFDFFDGWFARKLKGNSNFGAELDSLSDFISFGVAPSILIYLWSISHFNSFGWSITLFFSVCAALRLARFTADIYLVDKPIDDTTYFIGVPSPAAAILCLLPIFLFIELDFNFFRDPYLNIANLIVIGLLMVSKIPTVSLKKIKFSKKVSPFIILLLVIICIGLITNLWITLIILSIAYIYTIIHTIFFYLRFKI